MLYVYKIPFSWPHQGITSIFTGAMITMIYHDMILQRQKIHNKTSTLTTIFGLLVSIVILETNSFLCMLPAYAVYHRSMVFFQIKSVAPRRNRIFSKLICSETFTYTYMIDFSSWQNHKQLQLMALIMVFLRTHVANRKLTHPSTKILGTSFKKKSD